MADLFAETGLIVEYLVERYGPDLAPSRDSDLILALLILAALCRRLAYAAASAQAYVDRLGILAFPARSSCNAQVKLHLDYLGRAN